MLEEFIKIYKNKFYFNFKNKIINHIVYYLFNK